MSMCTFPYAIVNALFLLAGSSALAPPLGGGLERGGRSLWVRRIWGRGRRMGSVGRSRVGAARPQMLFFRIRSDHVCCAGIGLLLSSALPHQNAQTAPTSSMAARVALNRGPASSMVNIFLHAIVTAALSRLAGPSALAPPLGGELE